MEGLFIGIFCFVMMSVFYPFVKKQNSCFMERVWPVFFIVGIGSMIGALLIGVSRVAAAEFTFFLAVPVMFGLSFLKIIKFGLAFSATELTVLVIGTVVAFLVSILVIKFLMGYIKKHDFQIFGWYRIVLGILVILYFSFV